MQKTALYKCKSLQCTNGTDCTIQMEQTNGTDCTVQMEQTALYKGTGCTVQMEQTAHGTDCTVQMEQTNGTDCTVQMEQTNGTDCTVQMEQTALYKWNRLHCTNVRLIETASTFTGNHNSKIVPSEQLDKSLLPYLIKTSSIV